jgi:cold-inducible RNA-binding protein
VTTKELFVANLPWKATESDVRQAFEAYGNVPNVRIMVDRDSGRPRGFCFVQMASPEEAAAAIAGLNAKPFWGRMLIVDPARPRGENWQRVEEVQP